MGINTSFGKGKVSRVWRAPRIWRGRDMGRRVRKAALFMFALIMFASTPRMREPSSGPISPIDGWSLHGQRPDFSAKDIRNRAVSLDDFRGRRLLVVFFATCCCLHCPEEMPALARAERALQQKGILMLGVSIDSERPGVVQQYLRRWGVGFPVIYDSEGILFRAFELEGIPTTYFVGPEGRLEGRTDGINLTRWDEPQVRQLLDSWAEGASLPFPPIFSGGPGGLERERAKERRLPDSGEKEEGKGGGRDA